MHISPQFTATYLSLASSETSRQCWFSDDVRGCGSLQDIRVWWDELIVAGPDLRCYSNAGKCWLVIKPDKEETAKSIFEETAINILPQRRKQLGAAHKQYLNGKVEEWVAQLTNWQCLLYCSPRLVTFGLKHRCPSIMRVSMGSSYDG